MRLGAGVLKNVMKKILVSVLVAMALTGCGSFKRQVCTAKSSDVSVANSVVAITADLEISSEKIVYTYRPSVAVSNGGFENIKNWAIREALRENGDADVLIALEQQVEYDEQGRCVLITVSGFPARYTKFLSADGVSVVRMSQAFKSSGQHEMEEIEPEPKVEEIAEANPVVNKAPEGVVVAVNCESGMIKYRAVNTVTGEEVFTYGPIPGTEDIGEFLAVVNTLNLLKVSNSQLPIYTDNQEVVSWVKKRKCKSMMLEDAEEELRRLVARSENWLMKNYYKNSIMQWNTEEWGENPASFKE